VLASINERSKVCPHVADRTQCLSYAKETLSDFDDSWNDYLRYAPDYIFVYIAHACCMLVKLKWVLIVHCESEIATTRLR
jgi:hypothetical protein